MREVTERRKQRIWSVVNRRQGDLTLIMDNIHDPHNVSAVLRSCDAFGVKQVLLYYTTESFPLLGRKSSASAIKWVETQEYSQARQMLLPLREQGYQILATGFGEEARPLPEWDMTLPTAIVFSNEHSGISPELRQWVDKEMYIPMQGMIESLNVSVAAAITLYEAWRQRSVKGMYAHPSLDQATREDMFREWCEK
ncbi:MAG: TrmH family RNA methyltransferase [Desulfohalobiaceae bacterium]